MENFKKPDHEAFHNVPPKAEESPRANSLNNVEHTNEGGDAVVRLNELIRLIDEKRDQFKKYVDFYKKNELRGHDIVVAKSILDDLAIITSKDYNVIKEIKNAINNLKGSNGSEYVQALERRQYYNQLVKKVNLQIDTYKDIFDGLE